MRHSKKVLASSIATAALLLAPAVASAATNTANTTITASIASTISISSSGTVAIGITPVTGGAQTSASDTVTVGTNSSTGYVLTLADNDATTSLVKGSDTIAAHAGTYATPTALANNSWGYHIDGLGTFGTGGAVETNVTTSSIKYAGVPSSATPQTIKSTATTAAADVTTVWYGVKADTSKPNGAYADTVTYTATTH